MIFDATLSFSTDHPIVGDTPSVNVIDLGELRANLAANSAPARRPATAMGLPVGVYVTQGFNNLTSLTVLVQNATDYLFTSPVDVWRSQAVPLAALAKPGPLGAPTVQIPVDAPHRYVRLYFDVAGTPPTAGRVSAGVITSRDSRASGM